ncbi:MAG: hypothetical protein Q9187_005664 [Circinaria calcarea]
MESTEDKQWASRYLLDPLTAPNPSEETGPGTHYRSTYDAETSSQASASSPGRKNPIPVTVRKSSLPSPPKSTSPRQTRVPRRQEVFTNPNDSSPMRRSLDQASTVVPTSTTSSTPVSGLQRGNSLTSRFAGDTSHRPLDMIKREAKIANRAPHLRKKHIIGPDSIDSLDTVGGKYHHDGPFDATLLARNISLVNSPVEAVRSTTEETLKATPKEKIKDSIERHRPLDGVAVVPPGMTDLSGRTYNYEEGADLMVEDGNYKRWPGVHYLPEDLKGKGEPSFSIEKALKDHKHRGRSPPKDESGIELTSRPRASSGDNQPTGYEQSYREWESDMRRNDTTGQRSSGGLVKRFGSLKRRSNGEK